jgi:hypothetical protein
VCFGPQVIHDERQYLTANPHVPPNSQMEMLSSLVSEVTDAVIEFSLAGRPFTASFLTIVADWDMEAVSEQFASYFLLLNNCLFPAFCVYVFCYAFLYYCVLLMF